MEIKRCKRCGNEINPTQKKCANCGKEIIEFPKNKNNEDIIKTKQCFLCGNKFDFQLNRCPKCDAENKSTDYSQPKNKNMKKYIYNGETYESNGWFNSGARLLGLGVLLVLVALWSEISYIWVGLVILGIAGILYAVGYYKKHQGELNDENIDDGIEYENEKIIDDKDVETIMNDIKRNQNSPNFQFSAKILKNFVFSLAFDFNKYCNQPENLVALINKILDEMNKVTNVEKLYNIYIDYDENEIRKAIILQVPMVNYTECESNYIGIILSKENGEIAYKTSEYYKDINKFYLCSCTKDFRMPHNIEIITKEDFVNNI